MKKLFLLLLVLLVPLSTYSIDFNQALHFVSEKVTDSLQALRHFDAMKVTTVFLGIGVVTLLVDKMYPIFPIHAKKVHKHITTQYNLEETKKIVTQEIQQFLHNVYNPAMEALGSRIEKLASPEAPREISSLRHIPCNESIDNYEVKAKDVTEILNLVNKRLRKIRKKVTMFKEICLNSISKQKSPRIFSSSPTRNSIDLDSSPRESGNLDSDFNLQEYDSPSDSPRSHDDGEKEKPKIPSLNLGSSGQLHEKGTSPQSPSTISYQFSNHITN